MSFLRSFGHVDTCGLVHKCSTAPSERPTTGAASWADLWDGLVPALTLTLAGTCSVGLTALPTSASPHRACSSGPSWLPGKNLAPQSSGLTEVMVMSQPPLVIGLPPPQGRGETLPCSSWAVGRESNESSFEQLFRNDHKCLATLLWP